jgi:hypothetical protein
MATSRENGIDPRAAHAAGLEYLRNNKSENGKAAPTSPEKPKVKNQGEIDRVRETNRRTEAEYEGRVKEISKAVEGALNLVSKKLSSKNLSEKEKKRLHWISKSVKDAQGKMVNNKYLVEIKNGKNITDSRLESLPINGLMRAVTDEIKLVQGKINQTEKIQELKGKAEANKLDEDGKKREWRKTLNELPESGLKRRIIARAEEWKQIDEARGEKYDEVKMEAQLGEACFQVLKEYAQSKIDHLKKIGEERGREVQRLEKIVDTMDGAQENYFTHHYGKISSEINLAEQQKQNLYTIREANLISQDSHYREMLLEDYGDKLPKGFDSLDKQGQDYELAKIALDKRLILKMPKKRELQKVPDAVFETPAVVAKDKVAQSGNKISSIGVTKGPNGDMYEHILRNSNQDDPYDIENDAFVLGKAAVLKGDKEPQTSEAPKLPEKLYLIDISEIAKRMAWAQTEEQIQKEYKGMGKFMSALKGLTENKRRIEYYNKSLNKIKGDNNLMAAINERASGHVLPGEPRVSAEYIELLDKIVAEYKQSVADAHREVGEAMNKDPEVQGKFAELLYRFRTDKWEGAAYKKLDKRSAVELFVKENIAKQIKDSGKSFGSKEREAEAKGLLYANNFYEICESVSKNYDEQINSAVNDVKRENPEAGIEAIREAISKHVEGVQGLELQLGLKDRDLVNNRPKGILSFYEKMVSWSEGAKVDNETGSMNVLSKPKRVIGRVLLNPFVLGAVSAFTSKGAMWVAKRAAVGGAVALGATGFWVPLGIGAAVGGAWRMAKRSKDVKYDLAQELREETLGGEGSEILGEKGSSNDRRYGSAVMSFKDALSGVEAMKEKTTFTEAEMQKLAKIHARLQLERDFIASTDKKFTKVDLFNLEKGRGKRYGSTAADKSDLRIALKNLAIDEHKLQGRIDFEKGAILDIINNVNNRQENFRHKEMLKAGVTGAIMGLAGGVAAQSVLNWGGEHLEKLWGGSYFHNHGTQLGQIRDWAKGSHFYQDHFAHTPVSNIDRFMDVAHSRTHAEFMQGLHTGVDGGGHIEQIHTQDWYDNNEAGIAASSHTHNANELRLLINKDASGSVHFKVPVKEFESWKVHGNTYTYLELNKAFADGHIKMLFVPEPGSTGAHEAITFRIDPDTRELIIPPGSNIRALLDDHGMPKGKGYFGLGEEMGKRADGSVNYKWINSMRGNGGEIDYGAISQKVRVPFAPASESATGSYDSFTIPLVPPTRKVFLRPEERAKKEAEKNKKDKKKGKTKETEHGDHGHEGERGHNSAVESEVKKQNKELFDRAQVNKYIDTYQKRLTKEEKTEAGVNLKVIDAYWKEEARALKSTQEMVAKIAAGLAKKDAHSHSKGHGHDAAHKPVHKSAEIVNVFHEHGPTIEEYMVEAAKLQEAVEETDSHFARIGEIDKKIRNIKLGKSEDYDEDLDDLNEEFKERTGGVWKEGFKPDEHRKKYEEKLRPYLKDEEKKPEPAKDVANAKPAAEVKQGADKVVAKVETASDDADLDDDIVESTASATREVVSSSTLSASLLEKTGRKIHFDMDSDDSSEANKVKVLKIFEKALSAISSDSVKRRILNKPSSKHPEEKFKRGLVFGSPSESSSIYFDNQDRLRIPLSASPDDVTKYLENRDKISQERIKAKKAETGQSQQASSKARR